MIPWMCHYTVLQYTFVIFLPFMIIKNTQEQQKQNNQLTNHLPLPPKKPTTTHTHKQKKQTSKKPQQPRSCLNLLVVRECFQQSQLLLSKAMQLCKPSLKLSFITMAKVSLLFPELLLLLDAVHHGVRRKDLFTCLLLSPLAA